MKSNEERVQSIVLKAKRYKAERKMTLSTAAIVFCAVIAVTLQTSINENKVNINAKSSGERAPSSGSGSQHQGQVWS